MSQSKVLIETGFRLELRIVETWGQGIDCPAIKVMEASEIQVSTIEEAEALYLVIRQALNHQKGKVDSFSSRGKGTALQSQGNTSPPFPEQLNSKKL